MQRDDGEPSQLLFGGWCKLFSSVAIPDICKSTIIINWVERHVKSNSRYENPAYWSNMRNQAHLYLETRQPSLWLFQGEKKGIKYKADSWANWRCTMGWY